MKKTVNIITTIAFLVLIFGLMIFGIVAKDKDFSLSERRKLADFPEISLETVMNGKAMSAFGTYMADHFPLREEFRTMKAVLWYNVYGQRDNNGVYEIDGSLSKLDSTLKADSVFSFASKIDRVYNMYLDESNKVYFSLIPDKNYFLAAQSGYPAYDYEKMKEMLTSELGDTMKIVDIFPLLRLDDYYKTDSHWKSENLSPVAKKLLASMDKDFNENKEILTLDKPFHGVYKGQSALPLPAEAIKYPMDEAIKNAVVRDLDKNKEGGIYWGEGDERDRYTFYLNGSSSLLSIENKLNQSGDELVIFRDSFASALIPWFVESYSKITVVDIRYISPEMLKNFVSFQGADVLFLYSAGVVNNSETVK